MTNFVYTILVSIVIISLGTFSFLQFCIIVLELFFVFYFLNRIGTKFVYLELLSLIAVTQWLFAPMLAQRLGVNMDVSYEVYFEYAFPATLAYLFGLTIPLWNQKRLDSTISDIVKNIREKYYYRQQTGVILILIGLPFWILQNSSYTSLNYVFYLFSHLIMVGISLLLFTNYRFKWLWVCVIILILFYTSFLNGMIGSLIFWMFILLVIYSLNRPLKIPYLGRLLFLLLCIWIIIVLQASKTEYRILTWDIRKNDMTGYVTREIKQNPQIFYSLIKENVLNPNKIFKDKNILALTGRINQGSLVATAMAHVPKREDYGRGEVTIRYSVEAFIPRILWPDKPNVGQADYINKFAGLELGRFHSATLGALGDAYVDYGKYGFLFLGFMGFFVSGTFILFINKSKSTPTVLFWFLVLYFGTISITEISVAGYFNSVLKYVLFIVVVRFIINRLFKIGV